MPNQAVKKNQGVAVKPTAKVEVVGTTPAPAAPPPVVETKPVQPPPRPAFNAPVPLVMDEGPECPKCKDTKKVKFTEKGRGIVSVGPCECVKA